MQILRTSLVSFSLLLLAYLTHAQSTIGLPPAWTWQNPLPQGYALTDVHGFNDSTAVVIGDRGLVLRTTNTGRTWQVGASGTSFDLQKVQFVTDRIGWIGYTTLPPATGMIIRPGRGEVRKTTDGGLTWVVQPLGSWASDVYFQDFWFLSSTEGYALVTRSLITHLLRTQDGGLTWTPSPAAVPVSSGASAACLQFTDATHGWLASYTDNLSRGTVLHTADGGLSWQDRTPNPDVEVRALAFLNDSTGWVAGYSRFGSTAAPVYTTQNRGQTWQPQALGSPQAVGITFANQQHGVSLVYGGQLFITANGGTTWGYGNTPANVRRVRLLPSGVGWAVGAGGRVDRTTDFGSTWVRCNTTLTDRNVRRVQFPAPAHGWALPVNDQALLKTTARGEPWQRLSLTAVPGINWTSGAQIEAMDFIDQDTGYVAVTDFAGVVARYFVLKTTTAGQAWTVHQVVPPPAVSQAYNYSGLFLRTARHGVALWGSRGLLLTRDGGTTWQTPTVGTRKNLVAVSWATAQVGYAVGDSATVVKTTDGGDTWQLLPSFPAVFGRPPGLTNVAFTTAQTGYLAADGYLYRTTDGAQTWALVPGVSQVYHVAFGSRQRGWAYGDNQYLTADGGLTWVQRNLVPSIYGPGAFVDAYNNWAGDAYGIIARYSEKFLSTTPLAQITLCTGDSLNIIFAREGTFSANEQAVRVELSNARGRFRPGETRLLGQGTTSPVRVGVPAGLTASALYRIRVIRADSSVLGGDNGQDLHLIATPLAPLLATLPGQVLQATLPAASPGATRYEWEAGGVPVAGASGAQLTPRTSGAYRVRACSATCCGPWSVPSAVVLATRPPQPAGFTLYPNPARTTLWLERPAGAAAATVQLLDVTGRIAWQGTAGAGTFALPVQQLPAGLYLVRLQTPTGPPAVVRVVVEH